MRLIIATAAVIGLGSLAAAQKVEPPVSNPTPGTDQSGPETTTDDQMDQVPANTSNPAPSPSPSGTPSPTSTPEPSPTPSPSLTPRG